MTPVDITKVLDDVEVEKGGKQASTVEAIDWASLRPPSPVTAFAQPELITMARMPSPLREWRISRLTVTGAAWNLFLVKTAAPEQGFSDAMSARSGKHVLEALTPTWVPETRKPLG